MILDAWGWCDEELRLPLVPMQPKNREKMFALMDELGLRGEAQ